MLKNFYFNNYYTFLTLNPNSIVTPLQLQCNSNETPIGLSGWEPNKKWSPASTDDHHEE